MARMPELSLSVDIGEAEAQQAVDFLLIEDALGAALYWTGSWRCRRPSPPIARQR